LPEAVKALDEIFPAIRLPVDTVSGKQTGIQSQETQWAGSLGYEVCYSTSSLESPERATIIQYFFPDERDLGAMLTLRTPYPS